MEFASSVLILALSFPVSGSFFILTWLILELCLNLSEIQIDWLGVNGRLNYGGRTHSFAYNVSQIHHLSSFNSKKLAI